jgi:hypothetical protein
VHGTLDTRSRCGAHCRTTGAPCRNAPVIGRTRCRMHGARAGAPKGTLGRLTTGNWLPEVRTARRLERAAQKAAEAQVKAAVAAAERIANPPRPRGRPPTLDAAGNRVNPTRKQKPADGSPVT